jgi:opacity protein-like surface antigen
MVLVLLAVDLLNGCYRATADLWRVKKIKGAINMKKRWSLIMFALICSLVSPSRAEDGTSSNGFEPPRKHWYFGFNVVRQSLGGDFDGDRFYSTGSDVISVPKIDAAIGGGFHLGLKAKVNETLAIGAEGSFLSASHKSTFGATEPKVTYSSLNFDGKIYFNANQRVQPYLQAGIGLPVVTIEEGYTNGQVIKDATYTGVHLHAGPGVLVYLSQRLMFHAAAVVKRSSFNQVDYGSRSELNDELEATDVNFDLGLSLGFGG